MKKINKLGLCRGRHDIPNVTEYIFPCEVDPLDLNGMAKMVADKLKGIEVLELYITGLTVALIEVVEYCNLNKVALTLMRFDRETGGYYPIILKEMKI